MKTIRSFTVEEVRKINQSMIDQKDSDFSRLSPAIQKLINEIVFTSSEINSAYAAAKKELERT